MNTIQRRSELLIDIFGKFMGFDFGVFHLCTGTHDVFVPTKIHPNSVWVKIIAEGVDGCCQIPLNEVGYTLKCDGIVFHVTVESEECSVEWFAAS